MARNTSASQAKSTRRSNAAGKFLRVIIFVAVIIVVLSGWAWWHYVHNNSQRVFEAMLANSLKTTGVTRSVQQKGDAQQLNQTVEIATPLHTAQAISTLSQTGENAASVVTETIGTPFADYVRYLDIQSSQKNAQGKQLDFSNIKNIWGKTSAANSPTPQTNGELYNESILGVIPIANLPAAERKALLKQIQSQHVYDVDYDNVSLGKENGRPVYTYNVTIKPQPYVAMLKQLGHDIGLTQLENVDPSTYANSTPVDFQVSVDVWSGQLRSINYTSGDRTESLSGYGIKSTIKPPEKYISIEELQAKVQAIQ